MQIWEASAQGYEISGFRTLSLLAWARRRATVDGSAIIEMKKEMREARLTGGSNMQ